MLGNSYLQMSETKKSLLDAPILRNQESLKQEIQLPSITQKNNAFLQSYLQMSETKKCRPEIDSNVLFINIIEMKITEIWI